MIFLLCGTIGKTEDLRWRLTAIVSKKIPLCAYPHVFLWHVGKGRIGGMAGNIDQSATTRGCGLQYTLKRSCY